MVWIDLIYNLALLVALSVVSGFVDSRWKRDTKLGAILQGLVFGGAAVIGMLRPFVFAPGLIFDGRSVMISLGALFFGPWTAAVTCLMTIPLRVAQGGPGAVMGVSVILASAAIGVAFWLRRPPGPREVSFKTLLVFGIWVHLVMLALTTALPREMILPVLKRIGWPVILIYPLATVLIGKILSDQAARAGFLESLQESERRFRAIFNSTFQFTGVLQPDGTVTEANQAALDFAGIKLEDVRHRPFWEARWWAGNEARVRQLREALTRAAGGEFVRYEVELQGAGDRTAVVDFSIKPVRDAADRVVFLVPEGRDITERIRAEAETRAGEERLRGILETIPNGIVIVNRDGRISYANSGAERLLGLTRAQIADRTYNDPTWQITTVTGEPFPDEEQPFTRVMRTGETVEHVEQVIIRPDGQRVTLAIHAAPLRDAAGTVTGMVAAFNDITERQEAERALRESEERYRGLFTAMQEGFALHEIICDAQGRPQDYRYLEVNPAFERMTGIPRHRWIGHTVREVLPRVEARWIRDFGEVALTGVARTFEDYVAELDQHYEVLAYSPKLGLFAVVALDVTQRKRAEVEVERNHALYRRAIGVAGLVPYQKDYASDTYVFMGEGIRDITGYAPTELRSAVWREMILETVFQGEATGLNHAEAVRRSVSGEIRNWRADHRIRTRSGEVRWISDSSIPLLDAKGAYMGSMGIIQDITERKRVEAALRDSQQQLKAIFDNAQDGILLADADTKRFVLANPRIAEMLGYTTAELLQRCIPDIHPPSDLPRIAQVLEQQLAGELPFVHDIPVVRKDGSLFYADISVSLLDLGGRRCLVGLFRDITERKHAEEALRRSEASLARAQRVARLGSWEIDLATDALQWSQETYRIFGVKPESFTLTRAAFRELVHPEDRDRVHAAIQRAIQEGHAYTIDHRIRCPDGTERIVSERADVLTDAAGRVTGLVGTAQDVTELKRIEQALQRSEKHFRSIIDTVQDVISIVDVNGQIRFVSPSAERTLGYTPEQLLDQAIFEFIPGEEHEAVREALTRALGEPHQPVAVQHHFRHADGSIRFLESIGSLLGGEGVQALVVNSRDITDRRRLEDQLRQSQKMEAIGQLAAGVAHDFNNLLTIIQGNASLLLGTPGLSEEDTGSVNQITQAAERAAGLTRQLLMFSRKQVMRLAPVDLNEVVGNMTKMLQRILGEDITLRSEYAPNLPLIQADTGMLEQVLLNLAVNARDAMPDGGQLVIQTLAVNLDLTDLGRHPEAASGAHLRLSVGDTGCGIAPENLPRIFDPFFTTKEVGKGTGLGLATVYGIVKQHRGWIEVASEVGQGTTFQIFLPVAEGISARQRGSGAIQELPRGSEVILVVEDERAVRLLVNNLLQRCGYTVLMAESGVAALEVWKEHQHRIALLLTDMVMPDGMSGRELARRLKQGNPRLKVIYTSGYSAAITGEVPPLTEGVNFLQKPYPPHHLAKTVRACLDRA